MRLVRSLSQRVVDLFGHPAGLAAEPMARTLNIVNRAGNQRMADFVGARPGDRVLEVGFGGGAAISRTLGRIAPSGVLVAVDLSVDMAIRARRVFADAARSGALHVLCADVARLPIADVSVDHAYAMNSHQYWPSPADGIREIHRVLRTGGRLVLGMDTVAGIHLIRWFGPNYSPATPAQLVDLFRDAGFGRVTTRRLTPTVTAVIGERD